MFIPGCGCCGSGNCVPCCTDNATQVVLDFTTGSGGGVITEYEEKIISIECDQQTYTIVLDLACVGSSAQSYCLGVVSEDGAPRESNCMYYGGNEEESYSFIYFSCPYARSGTVIGGGTYSIFPGEAAFTFDRINWHGETRLVPFAFYGLPFFSIIRGWSRQRYRFYRFRKRVPPDFTIEWLAGGSGAQFSPVLSQHADAMGEPYWKIDSISVDDGGSGYSPFINTLTPTAVNVTGSLPAMRVSEMSYTPPTMSAVVSAASAAPAQLSVTMRQTFGTAGPNFPDPVNGIVPMWQVDFVTVDDGGSGYAPNASLSVSFAIVSGYYSASPWGVPSAFRAQTDEDGVITSVVHEMPTPNSGGLEGRGFVGPTASAVAAFVDSSSPITGFLEVNVTRTRTVPTLTANPPATVTGMSLALSLSKTGDGATAYWSVSSVTVTTAGTGWQDGDAVTFSTSGGPDAVAEVAAEAVLNVSRVQPVLSASAAGGTGATFSVTTAPNGTSPQTWGVSGISVTSGGTGYPAVGTLALAGTSVTVEEEAYAEFYCGRVAPTVSVFVSGTGSGAVLSGTLSSGTGSDGKTSWYVSAISITDGGSGYSEYDQVNVTVTDGTYGFYGVFYALVSVDEDGAVTGVTLYDGGEFFKSNGIIESVEVLYGGGSYYGSQLDGVTVTKGGRYYNQTFTDTSEPIDPLECTSYPSGWDEKLFESPVEYDANGLAIYPRVGDSYTFNDVFMIYNGDILEFPEIGHTATRRCADPEMTISIQ